MDYLFGVCRARQEVCWGWRGEVWIGQKAVYCNCYFKYSRQSTEGYELELEPKMKDARSEWVGIPFSHR